MAQTRLKQLREEAVLTVHELAEASGVSDDTISKIENGQRMARPSTLRKLAHALDVSPQELRRPAKVEEPVPLAEAPREAGRASLPMGWLDTHGAQRLQMSDEQVLDNFERLASGSDRAAIPERFEQEARRTFQEEDKVLDALRKEWTEGGQLLPKVEEGPDLVRRAFGRSKEYSRLGREIRRHYSRYLRALDNYGRALYLDGRADDFLMINRRPQTVEATKAALAALQEEAFEAERGA